MGNFKRLMASPFEKAIHPLIDVLLMNKPRPQNVAEWISASISWSQLGEDVVVARILEMIGKLKSPMHYVDVGAFHPIQYSNTLLFHKIGWTGINIDPNPETIKLFETKRPNDINLCLAISANEGFEDLAIYSSQGVCGTSRMIRDEIAVPSLLGEDIARVLHTKASRLDKVLDEHPDVSSKIGFLSIDVEGFEIEVLNSNDWEKYQPLVVAVEDHNPANDSAVSQFLLDKQYLLVGMCAFTKIFVLADLWPYQSHSN